MNIHRSLQFFDWQFCHRVTLVGLGPKERVLSHQNSFSIPESNTEDTIHYTTAGRMKWELLRTHCTHFLWEILLAELAKLQSEPYHVHYVILQRGAETTPAQSFLNGGRMTLQPKCFSNLYHISLRKLYLKASAKCINVM